MEGAPVSDKSAVGVMGSAWIDTLYITSWESRFEMLGSRDLQGSRFAYLARSSEAARVQQGSKTQCKQHACRG
jgi:hypothetical protein